MSFGCFADKSVIKSEVCDSGFKGHAFSLHERSASESLHVFNSKTFGENIQIQHETTFAINFTSVV